VQDLVTVVVMTRDRREDLMTVLPRLLALPGAPRVIVVDNGSTDGAADAVRRRFPAVDLVPLGENAGVAARNLGVELASTPYVAFADDDSWWSPEALERVIDVFERHPTIGALTGHVLVEPAGVDDPVTELMRTSPVAGDPDLPGIPVLGFLACAAAVRREAFLEVGGFCERLHFGGEEQLLAADLAARGWEIRYLPDAPVHHHPSASRANRWRQRRDVRNTLWFLWLRRHRAAALRRSWRTLREAAPAVAVPAALAAVAGTPWVIRERAPLPAGVEASLRRLDAGERREVPPARAAHVDARPR
jgi:N-acetylglucosaminyl-diphospho-decaprenol L-rhamnosyltransferase